MPNYSGEIAHIEHTTFESAYKLFKEHASKNATYLMLVRSIGDSFQLVLEAHQNCDKKTHKNCFVECEIQVPDLFKSLEEAKKAGLGLGERLAKADGLRPEYPEEIKNDLN